VSRTQNHVEMLSTMSNTVSPFSDSKMESKPAMNAQFLNNGSLVHVMNHVRFVYVEVDFLFPMTQVYIYIYMYIVMFLK
jgi:hypothetical protein